MRAFRFACVVLVFLLALPVLAAEISVDYHRQKDFSAYKTFSFGVGTPAANPTMDQHILACLEKTLTAAGLTKVEKGGDLTVRYSVEVGKVSETEKTLKSDPLTVLPKWDYSSFQDSGTIVSKQAKTEGALVVDLEEAAGGTLVWRGVASKYRVSGPNDAAFRAVSQAIRLMFAGFPPKPPAPPAPPQK